jgi:serine/threonine protein kinase
MGIIHRDIKPENLIFLSETTYELKLADFGLAEFKGEKNPLFVRCGTPGYVAPEVLKDEPYTEKVDIFATGIILYILYCYYIKIRLTGCTPFFGETYNEIIDKNQDGRVNYNFEEIGITVSDEGI